MESKICEIKEIPNIATLKAIKLCGNTESTEYESFKEFWQEVENEVKAEMKG